jgi:glycosyltransferase involved in cell wall biosynthesis
MAFRKERTAQPNDSPQSKLRVTAIVVGLNEADVLGRCLDSIAFCEELIYVDLGSTDNSLEIAANAGATILHHPRVPSGEYAISNVYRDAKYSWILFVDPDEFLDEELQDDLRREFENCRINETVGVFSVPWQFYFKQKKLHGTPWGGRRPRMMLAHSSRFDFLPETHRGRILRPGFTERIIESDGNLNHFWSNSWSSLIQKHLRYLKTEGGSRYRRGDRISLGGIVVAIPKVFVATFKKLDKRDGVRGVGLSLLWSIYMSQALLNLWLYGLNKKSA